MEITRLNSECIGCLIKKYLKYYPGNATEKQKIEYMQRVLGILANASVADSAPTIVDEISSAQKAIFGFKEDYSELKSYFNSLMMSFEDELKKCLDNSDDPLKLAICYAMTGNYIDFGAVDKVEEDKLKELLNNAGKIPVDENELSLLKNDLEKATKLVFLTDNCGEAVLDKIMMQEIKKLYPDIAIKVIVRGEPVLNDVTMDDAEQIGLTAEFAVTGNGSSVAGTCLEKISDEAKAQIDEADVIIAKGQGNFETLRFCNKNVYYIFMCKCAMFAERFGVEQFTGMLLNDFRLPGVI